MRPAVLTLIFTFLLVACSPSAGEGSGPELDRAYALADSFPDSALSLLDSLRRVSGLRESPRAGYIRARALLAERDYADAVTEALTALETQREAGDRDAALLSSDLVDVIYYRAFFSRPNELEFHRLYRRCEEAKEDGDTVAAFRYLEEMLRLRGQDNMAVYEVARADRDFQNSRSLVHERRALRFSHVVWALAVLVVLLVVSFAVFHRRRMLRRRREADERVGEIRTLMEQLRVKDELLGELDSRRALVDRLFRERFVTIDALSREYFEKRSSEATRALVVRDFEREIESLRSPEAMERLVALVDECRDGILTRLRAQMPRFRETDIRFIALVLAGFSPRSVCLFMDIKLGNYYNKSTRLRARIAASSAPDRDLFIRSIEHPF